MTRSTLAATDLTEAWLRGATARSKSGVVAKRSYPAFEVRGSGHECQAVMVQERLRGATPGPRSGAAARRRYPTPEARGGGRQELPHAQGQVWRPRGATPCPRSGG